MIKKCLMLTSMILAVILGVFGLVGCGDAGGEANTKAPVMLVINSLNGNEPYYASVLEQGTAFQEDGISMTLSNVPLDPDPGDTGFYQDIIVKGYEVSYFRKDTGTRVPETFTASMNVICEVDNSVTTTAIICRASQKQMPPLDELCDPGYDKETGLPEIHTTCSIVVWGETFAGEEIVSDPGNISVNFVCTWNN